MLELIFTDTQTGMVKHAITDVSLVRYITGSEVGYTVYGRELSAPFTQTEKLEVRRVRE